MSNLLSQVKRLESALDIHSEEYGGAFDPERFVGYRNDPVGFLTDVLAMDLWEAQKEVARAVHGNRLVRVRSAQGIGKTYVTAGLVPWWLYTQGEPTMVVTIAPTDRQVRELLWGEIKSLWRGANATGHNLPGKLYSAELRVSESGRHKAMGFSGSGVDKLTGFHHPKLLVIIDEAHGVEDWVFEAVFAIASGAANKILAIGNPGDRVDSRWRALNTDEAWEGFTVSALDHPNVSTGKDVIPGAVSRVSVEDFRREYGEASSVYRARVLGEFVAESQDSLVRLDWLERAAEKHELLTAYEAGHVPPEPGWDWQGFPLTIAVDPARFGADSTVMALRRGPRLMDLHVWSKHSTMETAGRVVTLLGEIGLRPESSSYSILVDSIGVGGGVVDRLTELGWRTTGINVQRPAPFDREKYLNLKAFMYWQLRRLLERGEIALPRDEALWTELLATRWGTDSSGKIRIERKADLRHRLGRSPDRADAIAMAFGATAGRATLGGALGITF